MAITIRYTRPRACWRKIRFAVFNSQAQETSLFGLPLSSPAFIASPTRVSGHQVLNPDLDIKGWFLIIVVKNNEYHSAQHETPKMKRIIIYTLCATICLIPFGYWIPPAKCKVRAKTKVMEESGSCRMKACCCSKNNVEQPRGNSNKDREPLCEKKDKNALLFSCACKYLAANKPAFLNQPICQKMHFPGPIDGTLSQKYIPPLGIRLSDILSRHLNNYYYANILIANCVCLT